MHTYSSVFLKYFVMSACGEMFAKSCCADLTTKSITRALVNQSIFKHKLVHSGCDLFLVFLLLLQLYSINAKRQHIQELLFDSWNISDIDET